MVLDGWLSYGLEDYHDIKGDVRELSMSDESVEELMAIHVLEHIHRWEVPATLLEWRRVLKPGGMLILEQPELLRCCRNVLDNPDARRGIWGLFGDPRYENPLMVHKWCWSEAELRATLVDAGFRKVRLMEPQFHGRKRQRDIRAECVK